MFGNISAIKRVEHKNKEGSRRGTQMAVVGLVSLYSARSKFLTLFLDSFAKRTCWYYFLTRGFVIGAYDERQYSREAKVCANWWSFPSTDRSSLPTTS